MKSPTLPVCIAIFVLAGCSHTIPETATKPQAPPQLGKTPPVIQPLSAGQKQAQAPESLLPVTMTADLTPVQKTIQAALPERFTEEHHPLSSDYRWRFIREGEPQVQIQDGLVKFNATYRGEIESTAARACRLDPLYTVLEGTGRLVMREQEQGLLVTMSDPQTSIQSEAGKRHQVQHVQYAGAGPAGRTLQTGRAETADHPVDRRGGLHHPVESGLGPAAGGYTGRVRQQQTVLVRKGQGFCDRLHEGPCPEHDDHRRGPANAGRAVSDALSKGERSPLKVHMDNSAAALQEGQPYKVLLSVPVPYAVLNQQLQEKLYHQEAHLPTTLGSTLVIERVVASDVNGRTLLAVDTSDAVKGTLYYWGTPQLEHEGNIITIPDLQIANETKMALEEIKSGYWQMVNDELQPRLREASTIDLSQRIGNIKHALSGQHKAGGLAMDLLLAKQEASQVVSTKDALVADVLLEGTASAASRLPVKQASRTDVIQPVAVDRSHARRQIARGKVAHADKSTTMEKSSTVRKVAEGGARSRRGTAVGTSRP